MPDLVDSAELQARLGGKITPEIIFLTALAMLVDKMGGSFSYTEEDVAQFKKLHAATGTLGLQIEGTTVTIFMRDARAYDA